MDYRHPELSIVALARPVDSDAGEVPAGAVGTVVHIYPEEQAYEVEFFRPFHAVATVEAASIAE